MNFILGHHTEIRLPPAKKNTPKIARQQRSSARKNPHSSINLELFTVVLDSWSANLTTKRYPLTKIQTLLAHQRTYNINWLFHYKRASLVSLCLDTGHIMSLAPIIMMPEGPQEKSIQEALKRWWPDPQSWTGHK